MDAILNQSDQAIIEHANTIKDWSTISHLRSQAERSGKNQDLISTLLKRETYVWYHYEKCWQ